MTPPQSAPQRPLDGITVLDFTGALAGPYATLLLAGLGARVVKVENPDGTTDSARRNAPYFGRDGASLEKVHDDDLSVSFLERDRDKLAVTLDLKHPAAREVLTDLLRLADVLVENWSPGVSSRLGVDYESVRTINPQLVYCSITGFGSDAGAGRKAMDTMIQALSGFMMTAGADGDPPVRIGIPVADLLAPLYAVIGTLAAVHHAGRTGEGQHVDVAMLSAVTALVAVEPVETLERLGIPTRTGNVLPRLAPFGVFPAADGYVAVCAPMDSFAHRLFAAMGRPELAFDNRFATRDLRVVNANELHGLIETWMAGRSRAEVIATLDANGVPAAAVREPTEAVRDPLVVDQGATLPLEHPVYGPVDGQLGSGIPIVFSASEATFEAPAPFVGQHNAKVYGELLGYSPARIDELRAEGVI